MNQIKLIIPARLASTRFPNKPLAKIHGIPLVAHCIFRAQEARGIGEIILATCDVSIAKIGRECGVTVAMTAANHANAISRTAEVVGSLPRNTSSNLSVIMLQGDEPLISIQAIEEIEKALRTLDTQNSVVAINAVSPIREDAIRNSPDCPKAIISSKGRVIYMSRSPIPHQANRDSSRLGYLQTGLIGLSRPALDFFRSTKPGPIELSEGIDMLRFIENGESVRAALIDEVSLGVDRPSDLPLAEAMLLEDATFPLYQQRKLDFLKNA